MRTRIALAICIGVLASSSITLAQKARSGVPLSVTIADRSDGEYRIESDGAGAYQDGVSGVSAVLDQYGNLIVNFAQPRRGAGRLVAFDYSCPVDEDGVPACGSATADPPSGLHSAYISTVCRTGATCARIQDMAPGASQCVQLNWQFVDGSGRTWRNGFHRDRDLPDQEGTAHALVTRDVTQSLWTVEPRGPQCGSGTDGYARTFMVDTVKSGWRYTDFGLFSLPFRLTLVPLN